MPAPTTIGVAALPFLFGFNPLNFLIGKRPARTMREPSAKPRARSAPVAAPPANNPIIALLDEILGANAPFQIPGKLKFLMVKFGPWLVIALMLLVLPGQLIGVGMRAAVLPFASFAGTDGALMFAVTLVTLLFLIVVLILALPGLHGRKQVGWQLMALANTINLLYGLLSGAIIGPILGFLIGFYVLFQIRRSYY